MYRCVCVLAIFGVSASMMQFPSPGKFHFLRSEYRRTDSCNICYDNECLPFDQDRCDYYAEANSMLQKEDEDPVEFQESRLRESVDSIMFDIVEKANQASDKECIPFVSRYTDCNKETVCIGCKTCQCDADGKWKCVLLSECRFPELDIDINHQILATVIDNLLNSNKSNRRKRSNDSQQDSSNYTVTPEESNDWFYEMHFLEGEPPISLETTAPSFITPEKNSSLHNTTKNAVQLLTAHTLESSTTSFTTTTDSDYLAFDDVLKNIAVENRNYTRRKPSPEPIDEETIDLDFILAKNNAIPLDNPKNNTEDILTEKVITESNADDATKVVIDLLESVKNNDIFNETDYMDMIDNKNDLISIDKTNNIRVVDNNILNIVKREISAVSKATDTPNITYTTTEKLLNVTVENATDNILNETYLKKNILRPLVKVINNKDKEIDELIKIKQNLITFMKANNQSPIVEILDYPDVSETNTLHDIEMFPDLAYEMRRSDTDMVQFFIDKLKADVYEVTKDIMNLRRYEQNEIPKDLATLVEALQNYVLNVQPLEKPDKIEAVNNFTLFTRRRWEQNVNKCPETTFKECVVEILQTIDKGLPTDNVIPALSPFSRRIIMNIIRVYNVDDFSAVGMRVHDPTYNITDDLKSLGSKWQDKTHNIIVKSPFVTLYRMKLVHLFLKIDINKIKDALTIVEFALNRRMIPYFKNVPNNIIDHINKEVKSTYNKMQVIVEYYSKYRNKIKDILTSGSRFEEVNTLTTVAADLIKEQHYKKKNSFIERIRNLLKSSKGDGDKNGQKLPKSEIVKQLALKKLNHLAQKRYLEYEEAMKKWQKALGVLPRSKRDLIKSLRGRIKNIIPKYLRHKVNPKLSKKKTNQLLSKQRKKKNHGHNKQRKTTLTTATTPKTKPTTITRQSKSTTKSRKRNYKNND